MTITPKITNDILYVGASEGRHPLFENIYPVTGMSYNAYVVLDEKTVLTDTADETVRDPFLKNLEIALAGRPLDYLFVHHVEPDHAALVQEVLTRYPDAKIICTVKAQTLLTQFFNVDIAHRIQTVNEGETLTTGRHTFTFYTAPMVHWPEVMVSYDQTDKVLFSADAFGTFGELNGSLFTDSYDLERDWLPEARRYYTNIVGKYGMPVQTLLKKAATLDIQLICPLHGPIWRKDLPWLLDKYNQWSTYTPEGNGVLILYGSIYGHTEQVARTLAGRLAEQGNSDVVIYDVSKTHPSYLVAEAFRCRTIVALSVTYNNGIFPPMETILLDLKAHALQNRRIALVQNGSWAPASGKLMNNLLADMKNITVREEILTLKSAITPGQKPELQALTDWVLQ